MIVKFGFYTQYKGLELGNAGLQAIIAAGIKSGTHKSNPLTSRTKGCYNGELVSKVREKFELGGAELDTDA